MVKMWPEKIPPDIRNFPLRSAECKVFDKLNSELGAGFVVFYSRPWHGLTSQGVEIDGECDFVIAHPQHGVLFVEVKGGVIAYDPAASKWTSTNRNEVTFAIKNPIEQAKSSKYNLLCKLKQIATWPNYRVNLKHGVIFPDCEVPLNDLGADMPRDIFCDRTQFKTAFKSWIKKRLSQNSDTSCKPMGMWGISALEELLAQPITLHRPLLFDVEDNDRVIKTLTQNQFSILSTIQHINRAAISGGAGTGKTVLAQEEAIRCSEKGLSTLFVCYNNPLATHIQNELLQYPEIPILTFHSLCGYMAKESGQYLKEENHKKFYEDTLPDALIQASEILPHMKYDVIIVDEGQDFMEHWWIALDCLLKDSPNARLRIFWDNNQAVYGIPSLPINTDSIEIPLDKNLRNSRQIFDVVRSRYKGTPLISAGPEGKPNQWLYSSNRAGIVDLVAKKTTELVVNEKVRPEDIAILTIDEAEAFKDALKDALPGNSIVFSRVEQGKVVVDTVRRFKGLERPVVIVAATEKLLSSTGLQYIAFSRARICLIVVGYELIINQLK